MSHADQGKPCAHAHKRACMPYTEEADGKQSVKSYKPMLFSKRDSSKVQMRVRHPPSCQVSNGCTASHSVILERQVRTRGVGTVELRDDELSLIQALACTDALSAICIGRHESYFCSHTLFQACEHRALSQATKRTSPSQQPVTGSVRVCVCVCVCVRRRPIPFAPRARVLRVRERACVTPRRAYRRIDALSAKRQHTALPTGYRVAMFY